MASIIGLHNAVAELAEILGVLWQSRSCREQRIDRPAVRPMHTHSLVPSFNHPSLPPVVLRVRHAVGVVRPLVVGIEGYGQRQRDHGRRRFFIEVIKRIGLRVDIVGND